MKPFDCVIVGGGASGVIAALSARKNQPNADIMLIEKETQLLRKVSASGNGRCNISNKNISPENYFSVSSSNSQKTKFVQTAFSQFSFPQTKDFFSALGIHIKTDHYGRAYPYAEQAEIVVDALSNALKKENITVLLETEVKKIVNSDQQLKILFSSLSKKTANNSLEVQQCHSSKIILACGSSAANKLGGSKLGYKLLSSLKVDISEVRPALVPLKLELGESRKLLSGQRFKARAELYKNGDLNFQTEGEFLFTKEGLSGISAMELARFISKPETNSYNLMIDFIPELDHKEITIFFQQSKYFTEKNLQVAGTAFIRKNIAAHLANKASDLKTMVKLLKSSSFKVLGSLTEQEAQVMAGGLVLEQIFLPSFSLKRDPRIYVCGELIDIDGRTGGFNLQWAWTSGYLAGKLLNPY